MKNQYARALLWLIRPALDEYTRQREKLDARIDAAIAAARADRSRAADKSAPSHQDGRS